MRLIPPAGSVTDCCRRPWRPASGTATIGWRRSWTSRLLQRGGGRDTILRLGGRRRRRVDHLRRHGLAVSLVSAGRGVAPLTVAPFARWLISTYEWRPAMMIVGIAAWILLVPAALLVRRPPIWAALAAAAAPARGVATPLAAVRDVRMTAGEAFRTPQFAALALAHFACCAAHSGPIFHMVSYIT